MNDIRSQRGDPSDNPEANGRAYEESDVNPLAARLTLGTAVALVIIVSAAIAGLFLWFGSMREPAHERLAISDAPALQVSERADRAKIEARARARLQGGAGGVPIKRSEEHTSELQSLMRISYAVFCLKKKKNNKR